MASHRVFSAFLLVSLTLASCQSASQKASNDEVKVAKSVELVCSARNDVDQAVEAVYALTPESTVAQAEKASKSLNKALKKLKLADEQLSQAELREYRDQVKIFRDAVDAVRKDKDLTLAEAANKLKGKEEPVLAAKEQLMSITLCIDIEQSSGNVNANQEKTGVDDQQTGDKKNGDQKNANKK